MYKPDSSAYERQVIDALKSILRALGSTGGTTSTSYTSSSSTSPSQTSNLVTALNGVSTQLDGINAAMNTVVNGSTTNTASTSTDSDSESE